jgi:hypothetical protein
MSPFVASGEVYAEFGWPSLFGASVRWRGSAPTVYEALSTSARNLAEDKGGISIWVEIVT